MVKKKIDDKKAMELYQQGYSDIQISKKFNCHWTSVRVWRMRRGLPANGLPRCIKEIEHLIPDNEKPWHDPESLFCDGAFLEKLTGKKIKVSSECTGEKE